MHCRIAGWRRQGLAKGGTNRLKASVRMWESINPCSPCLVHRPLLGQVIAQKFDGQSVPLAFALKRRDAPLKRFNKPKLALSH
jgi:hypothetical protein